MTIVKDSVVSIDYTLTNDAGNTLDSSSGRGPLQFIQGYGQLIPGLEAELMGKTEGEAFNVSIPPAQGYGERDDSLLLQLDRDRFQDSQAIEVGMQFRGQFGDTVRVLTVTAVDDSQVTADGNHPLAGQTLHFDVKVQGVRAASEDELAQLQGGCCGGGGGCGCKTEEG